MIGSFRSGHCYAELYTYSGRYSPSYNISSTYSGVQSTWVHEICDISSYASNPFFIRFVFYSDPRTYFVPMDGWYIDNVKISVVLVTGVEATVDELPAEYSLLQNYPNPFNPSTTIEYALRTRDHVTLTVYNLLGQGVAMLVDEVQQAGHRSVDFKAEGLPSGVYFYQLKAGDIVLTKRLLLLR